MTKLGRTSGGNWLLLVLLNSLFIQGGIYVVRPIVTYKSIELGADATWIGVIGAAWAVAPLILAIPIGRFVDKGKDGLALFAGASTLLLVSIAMPFINNVPLIMLAMTVMGLGHLLVMVGGQTMIANRSGSAKYERDFGLFTFYASLGHALGPLAGGWLADTGTGEINTAAPFWFSAVIFALGVAASISLANKSTPKAAGHEEVAKVKARDVLALPKFKSAIYTASASTSVVDVLLIFLPLLGTQNGMTPSQIGILLGIRSASSMLVRGVLGQISRRFGMRFTLEAGVIVTLVSCVLLIYVTDFWIIAAILAVAGFAMGIGQPMTMAWVSRISPANMRGLAISIRLTANRFGQVVAPAAAGLIAGAGVSGVFWMLAGIQAVSIWTASKADGNSN
jgi:MFS family permease